jgi:SAM-dependent methyltransferase
MSFGMPYADGLFDTVFSSLFFHHLRTGQKRRTLTEIRRVLKPGGSLRICDWGPAAGPYARLAFTTVRILDGFAVTRDSVDGRLPDLVAQADFSDVLPAGELATVLGTLGFLTARKRPEGQLRYG